MCRRPILQQTVNFLYDVAETTAFSLIDMHPNDLVRGAGQATSSAVTILDYVDLAPYRMDYTTPETYRQTLDDYTDNLFNTAGSFIPGGFDRQSAPSYRDVFVQSYATSGWGNLPEFVKEPLDQPPPPAPNVPPGNPGYCFPRRSGTVSHVEVFYAFDSFSDSEESYPLYTEGGDYIGQRVINRWQSRLSEQYIVRVFFPWSQKRHLFNSRLDLYPEGAEPFECPEACERAGLTGGCFEVRSVDGVPIANGYAGYTKLHELYLNLGGSCYKIFGFQEFEIALVQQSAGGIHTVYGYRRASINFRLVYNPLNDYPYGKEFYKPPYPGEDMAEKDCCSCRRIAAMLAVQTTVQTAINGAIAVAQLKAILAALAVANGLRSALDLGKFQFSLFDSLIGLDSIIDSISDALSQFSNENQRQPDEDGDPVDLISILERLEYLKNEVDRLRKDAKRTYNILGGEAWFSSENTLQPRLELNPEDIVRASRNTIFPQDDGDCREIQATSILGLMGAFEAVNHHRSGAYRLPGKLPKTLFNEDDEEQMSIPDLATLTQWLAVQMDGIAGQYPLKIKYKNADGESQTLSVQNQSEILAEILGLLLGISTDVDISVELGMKSTVEAIKASNAAILAADYSKANAEFLGYKGKEIGREIPLTITPQAKNLKDALKESKMKGSGWKFEDKEDLQDLIRRLLVGVEIVKAAFFNPFDEDNERFPGERMRQDQKEVNEAEDQAWSEFIANTENPPARLRRDENSPRPDLKDVSVNKDVT